MIADKPTIELLDSVQAELEDGHLALDRLEVAREDRGCELTITERIHELASRNPKR